MNSETAFNLEDCSFYWQAAYDAVSEYWHKGISPVCFCLPESTW
jgi:hypothetical protein